MAFQGNLRDFSVTEILQLLGTQKKTGCLMMEWNAARAMFFVHEGKLVSTRPPGLGADDPLLKFLIKARRLSSEQVRGILTLQRESNRDLEDLLVNGRYIEAEELGAFIERQILDDLMRVMTWQSGSYRFDPMTRWPYPPLGRLGVEAALIEVARRVDEQRRFSELRRDPFRILAVRDLPDAEEQLTEEECELFGIIDGRHTVAEIVEAAPLSEYEAYEALQRMLEANWVEFSGRRDPEAAPEPAPAAADEGAPAPAPRPRVLQQAVLAGVALGLAAALALAGRGLQAAAAPPPGPDAFQAAGERDVRWALEQFRREHHRYPPSLDDLVRERWVSRSQIRPAGRALAYRLEEGGRAFKLEAGAP